MRTGKTGDSGLLKARSKLGAIDSTGIETRYADF
jgi:hypothetical protein